MYGSDPHRGGGCPPGGPEFFEVGSPKFFWATSGKFYIYFILSSKSSAQAQSIGTLFEQIGSRGGGICGHVQKSEAHAIGCRQRGESRQ